MTEPPVEVLGVDHVGILTRDFDAVREVFAGLLGVDVHSPETEPELGIEVLWVHVGGVALEFIRAIDPESATGRRYAEEGDGVNHLAVTVRDAAAALQSARSAGIATREREPRRGVRNSRIGFLDPAAAGGTLVEFVEPAPAG